VHDISFSSIEIVKQKYFQIETLKEQLSLCYNKNQNSWQSNTEERL